MNDQAKLLQSNPAIVDRRMVLEIVRVTERAAIAAARWRGKGDEKAADDAAVEAMRTELAEINVDGRVVIGEGERDKTSMLYVGEKVGAGAGPQIDIALDPLEGTTLCAKSQPDSLSVLALAERGGLLCVPDVYMHKIAVGPGLPPGVVDIDRDPRDNVRALAEAKKVTPEDITVCILDRPRHAVIVEAVREAGASVKLIYDGDIAGVMHAAMTEDTGIDLYLGSGGAPEGVLAAAALRCLGGQMQGRLILDTREKRARADKLGIEDPDKTYVCDEMASGDVMFAATGVTNGNLLSGVEFRQSSMVTATIVMRSWSRTVRWITARHPRHD